jgi:hypothetical protein
MPADPENVRFQEKSGKHMLVLSSSQFGTFDTCRWALNMSANRARPEVIGARSERRDDPFS